MSYLIPKSFWSMPTVSSLVNDDEWGFMSNLPSGLAVSEDDKSVYVEAAVPGVDAKNIDITYEKGIVRISAALEKEEKQDRKHWKRSQSEFSYQFNVPGEIDQAVEPVAEVKNGIVNLTFTKAKKTQPKKITLKSV